jgi:hypothetical protein
MAKRRRESNTLHRKIRLLINNLLMDDKKLSEMHELCSETIEGETADPITKVYIGLGNMAEGLFNHQVSQDASLSGTKAAVEIYLVLAKTGRLPEQLQDHLPKDPFTGKDFVYEITDEGFALRCASEDFKKESLLEFRVHR